MEELTEQTDRGAALLAAAYLDDALKEMLQKRFVGQQNETVKAFQGNGPLATFSSRIMIAFLLGLITEMERRDMDLIRRIRNDFAHLHEAVDFSEPPHSQRCLELAMRTEFERLNVSPNKLEPRQLFIGTSCFHVINLVLRTTALCPLGVLITSEYSLGEFVKNFLQKGQGPFELS